MSCVLDVPTAGGCFTFWLLIYRVLKLVVFVICAIPGTVLYSPVAFIANHISNKKAREALASSNVKIAGTVPHLPISVLLTSQRCFAHLSLSTLG